MLNDAERQFLERARVARLATADVAGAPHVVPICYAISYAISGANLYITIDGKPKRAGSAGLKRLANIRANPAVAVVVDRYAEDWTQLGWVMLRGTAEILTSGTEHDAAQALLRDRYLQYRDMAIDALPVIAVRIIRTTSWGNLTIASNQESAN